MARRVFLHIGTPKSGTTYLQSLWWRNAAELRSRGLLLPGGNAHVQFQASAVVRANAGVLAAMSDEQRGAWDRVVEESHAWPGDVLISQEQLVEAPVEQIRSAFARLGAHGAEVHVVLTGRDLVRQVPSAWQQRVKHGSPTTLRRFCERLAEDDPHFNFWHHQDLARILERWSDGLPPERVHLLPLPRPGADRDELWWRTASLLGLDDSGLDLGTAEANETLAPAEIAFLREVNTHYDDAHLDVATSRRLRGFLGPRLGHTDLPQQRLLLPADLHPWFVARGNRMVDELAAAGWDVVGDVDDLRPATEQGAGVDPDAIDEDEVLSVALDFIAHRLAEQAAPTPPGAVSEPPAAAPKRGSLTALRRVVARLTGRR